MLETYDLKCKEFVRLRCSEDPKEYHRAAHDSAHESIWLEVVSTYPEMRKWVAQNKTVPINIPDILSIDTDSQVRFMVTMKRKLPETLQLRLAHDSDSSVRHALACHIHVTTKVLHILAEDTEQYVRKSAAQRLLECNL